MTRPRVAAFVAALAVYAASASAISATARQSPAPPVSAQEVDALLSAAGKLLDDHKLDDARKAFDDLFKF